MEIRNIKFKAKRLDNSEWVKGYFYKECGNTYIIEDRQSESMLNRNEAHQVDPSTVCQFTGLKDCEGNEIWEHDLLQSQETKAIYEVVWNQGNTSFSLVNTECPILYSNTLGGMLRNIRLKVVGNKFDKKRSSVWKDK